MFESDWFCLHFLQLQSHGPTLSSGFKMRGFRGLDFRGSGGGSSRPVVMLAALRASATTSITGLEPETEAAEPEAAETEAVESEAAETEAAEPKAAETEAAEPEATDSEDVEVAKAGA